MQNNEGGLIKQDQLNTQTNLFVIIPKTSLCRHFLRGNCLLPAASCLFAHGMQQLKYTAFDAENQKDMTPIYRDFRAVHPINQLEDIIDEGNKNYINLYQFQLEIAKKQTNSQKPIQKIQADKITDKSKSIQTKAQKKKKGQYQHKLNLQNQKQKMQEKQIYESNKIYSLQEINNNRNLKIQIRKRFHQHQFQLFLHAIEMVYSHHKRQQVQDQYRFAYDIVQNQYFRVGFNKLMTRIKFSFVLDYLQFQHRGGHFKLTSLFPPFRNKTATFYIQLAPQAEIISFYNKVYQQVSQKFKQENKAIREQDIKQAMIRVPRNWWRIPPITQVLRILHCTFKDFLIKYVLEVKQIGNNSFQWITDQTLQLINIREIIEEQIKIKGFCFSQDILVRSSKYSRSLIEKCVCIQRRESEMQSKKEEEDVQSMKNRLVLIKCPNVKTEIITKQHYLKPQSKYQYQFGIKLPILLEDIIEFALIEFKNQHQQKSNQIEANHSPKNIIKNVLDSINTLEPDTLDMYKVIQISCVSQLLLHEQNLTKRATLLGIDLQGDLGNDEQSYLSLIQINHYSEKIIYLIDFLTISQNQTDSQIQKCKSLLTKIFNDPNKVKIIHDSRNDAQCLYHLLKRKNIVNNTAIQEINLQQKQNEVIKFSNIFDTAASQQVIQQLRKKQQGKIHTPGLNEVLEKYGQTTNYLKKKFHSMWEQGKSDPGIERPLSNEFKEYCALDVLGLPKVYKAMSQEVNPYFLVLVSQLHADFSQKKGKNNV